MLYPLIRKFFFALDPELAHGLGMSGIGYFIAALALDAVFVAYVYKLWRNYSDELARRTFRWSIIYLTLIFAALLAGHFL